MYLRATSLDINIILHADIYWITITFSDGFEQSCWFTANIRTELPRIILDQWFCCKIELNFDAYQIAWSWMFFSKFQGIIETFILQVMSIGSADGIYVYRTTLLEIVKN